MSYGGPILYHQDPLIPYYLGILCPDLRACLLYTSDAADDLLCVDLGGRRILKKNTYHHPV